jgi:hypothetical protein
LNKKVIPKAGQQNSVPVPEAVVLVKVKILHGMYKESQNIRFL